MRVNLFTSVAESRLLEGVGEECLLCKSKERDKNERYMTMTNEKSIVKH